MGEEIVTLLGIIPEAKMECLVNLDEVQSVMCRGLSVRVMQLSSFFNQFLNEIRKETAETANIDIKAIFHVLEDKNFYDNVSNVISTQIIHGRDTMTNLRLIKTGLYLYCRSIEDIRNAMLAYKIVYVASLTSSIRAEPNTLIKVLRSINRFMPKKLVEVWLRHCRGMLRKPKKIYADEFLFLLSNAVDRQKTIKELIPDTKFTIEKDKWDLTYVLDDGLKQSRAPDKRIEYIMKQTADFNNVNFELEDRTNIADVGNKEGKGLKKVKTVKNSADDLRPLLQRPELFLEIKKTLQQANSMVKSARARNTVSQETFDYLDATKTFLTKTQSKEYTKESTDNIRPIVSASQKSLLKPSLPNSARYQPFSEKYTNFKPSTKVLIEQNFSSNLASHRPFSAHTKCSRSTRPQTHERDLQTTHYTSFRSFRGISSRPVTAGTRPSTAATSAVKEEPYKVYSLREATILASQGVDICNPNIHKRSKSSKPNRDRWRI